MNKTVKVLLCWVLVCSFLIVIVVNLMFYANILLIEKYQIEQDVSELFSQSIESRKSELSAIRQYINFSIGTALLQVILFYSYRKISNRDNYFNKKGLR
ncbi:hypothetical protein DMA11_21700 [Marinilabiliaceae bacterium JC017]|nr:hypothetical protein DMA11_21700 [Marinilabiliaceae bacterium JC017]